MIRLFTFRPDRPGESADDLLRGAILPVLAAEPRMTHFYAARANVDEQDHRIAVSVWDDDDRRPGRLPALELPLGVETSEHVLEPRVELHRLEVTLSFIPSGAPQILRVFRGRAKPGQLDSYIEHVRDGTLADAVADHGPDALFLARVPPNEFVTISAWSGWDRIAAATGGNIRQPIATRHTHLLEGGTASFYEIVPNTNPGPVASATSDRQDATAGGDTLVDDDPANDRPALLAVLSDLPAAAPGS